MVELHANSNPGMALTFRDGLARTLLRPHRRPGQVAIALTFVVILADFAQKPDFGSSFWALCYSGSVFYVLARLSLPCRLTISGVPPANMTSVLTALGCTRVQGSEPQTWRVLLAPAGVKLHDIRFNLVFNPAEGALVGTFGNLIMISRRLRSRGRRRPSCRYWNGTSRPGWSI